MPRYLLLTLVFLFIATPASATILTTSSPNITEGRTTVRSGTGYEDRDSGGTFWTQEVEGEYSPTDYWKTGFKFLENYQNGAWGYAATGWKNTFQFMKQKNGLPFNAAVRIEYEKVAVDDRADDVKLRLLTGRKDGAITSVLNAGIRREIGANRSEGISADFRAQVRYSINDYVAPAIDYLGNIGTTNQIQGFDTQDHRLGMSVHGIVKPVGYQFGYMRGVTDAAPNNTFMMNLSYDF